MSADIQIRRLAKKYGQVVAVDGLDLTVDSGEMMGLIGPDGAGKTTTMRILCNLLNADSGECFMAGFDCRKQERKIRQIIGYMPQRFSLYPDLTVAENLRFFADLFRVNKNEREKRLARLLEFSRLGPFSSRQAHALSGGMKQKLALSCTLIHTPRILLLDEPTTGVDPVSRREFWDILKELRSEGVTIMVSTPYMDEAAKCDRVAFVHKGKILNVSRPEQVSGLFQGALMEIRCDGFVATAKKLAKDARFEMVQVFGDRIHVSARTDETTLKNWIRQTMTDSGIRLTIKPVAAAIEDVFVQWLK